MYLEKGGRLFKLGIEYLVIFSSCSLKSYSLLGSLPLDLVEQPETAVITPAMREEEEQLEAAGLESERKMLERVSYESSSSSLQPVVTWCSVPGVVCGLRFTRTFFIDFKGVVLFIWFYVYTCLVLRNLCMCFERCFCDGGLGLWSGFTSFKWAFQIACLSHYNLPKWVVTSFSSVFHLSDKFAFCLPSGVLVYC